MQMTLLEFDFHGHRIKLVGGEWNGSEALYVDDELQARRRNPFSNSGSYPVDLGADGVYQLDFRISLTDLKVSYTLSRDGQIYLNDEARTHSTTVDKIRNLGQGDGAAAELNPDAEQRKGPRPWMAIFGVGLKLMKSGTAVKAALAGGSYAGWALLTNWQFAAVLIAILVFHEYGHLRAMRSFGIPTKGMYLIPFFGGIAVGERADTYWQETYISMMGPVYGLFMTVVAWLGYAMTGSNFLGLLASYSALINLFNLLPIYPLDGGHVIKASALSLGKRSSIIFLLVLSAVGFAVAAAAGLFLLTLFIVLGAIDLASQQNLFRENDVVPMKPYGIAVSLAWYVSCIVVFVLIILQLYQAGVPGSEVPFLILTD